MKNSKQWTLRLLLVCLCLSLLTLVGCDKVMDKIKPHEHTFVKHPAKAATCTEAGHSAYETCSECDEYNTYKEIPALGHNYSQTYSPNGDVHSRFCSRCGDTVDEEHNFVPGTITKASTCTDVGEQTFTCSVCNVNRSESIPALGHDYIDEYKPDGDVHNRPCSRCDLAIDAREHDWSLTDHTDPNCENEGADIYTCSVCGAEKLETIASLGHDFVGEFKPDGDVHSRSCSRCSALERESHVWQVGERQEPTCAIEGKQFYTCDCGAEKSEPIDVNDAHSWELTGRVEPTCSYDGCELYTCSICEKTDINIIPPTGQHDWQLSEYVESTCVKGGYQTFTCSECSAKRTEDFELADHTFGYWSIIQDPTATEEGCQALHCGICGNIYDYEAIPAEVTTMPVIYLTGDYTAATNAKNEVKMTAEYVHPNGQTFSAYATIKVQGSSSVAYPKKNYTIKFFKASDYDKKLKVDLGWGAESKYVMKANWVDYTQARNIVSCRIWGQMIKTRPFSATQERLAALKTNGGAIDGFPIAVYMNGEFYGLYTMNVPKDEWMFDMGDSETEALLAADDWNSTDFNVLLDGFKEDSNGDLLSNNAGWELRYYGTEDTTGDHQWVTDSFNRLILFCQNNEGEAFRNGIAEYLDVDAAIDYLILMYTIYMRDNSSKNMLWATYDGKVWIPSAYDQDGTFGQVWDGVRNAPANQMLPIIKDGKIDPNIPFGPSTHPIDFILWKRLLNDCTEQILMRYKELRETVLSYENIVATFEDFRASVPESVYVADREYWADGRNSWWAEKHGSGIWYEKYDYEYIYGWQRDRLAYLDNAIENIYYGYYLPNTNNPKI